MNIIFLLHALFLLAILIVPFTNNERNLKFYSIIIPFLFYHWSVNDDTCALTQAEMYVTGKHKDETFMGRLVGPIYKMPETDVNKMTKTTFFVLWAFVQYRLGYFDLFFEDLNDLLKTKKVK
jgi:hypothetical protein